MFDRGYSIICRDASVPIGLLHIIRLDGSDDPSVRLARLRAERASCAGAKSETVADIGTVEVLECTLVANPAVPYRVVQKRTARHFYSAEGLGGYDSALKIGIRSLVTDQPVVGEVDVALTGAGDPAAFARVQAGTLDRARALAEAYRRNNSGAYAESAEFFSAVTRGELGRAAQVEALTNEALQKSNLGHYSEADELLGRASAMLGNDPLVARQLRNYRAMHLLNQGRAEESLAELEKPLPDMAELPVPAIRKLTIDKSIAARLNADGAATEQIGDGEAALQFEEKVQILDAQVDLLKGPAYRLLDQLDIAGTHLKAADSRLSQVRGGRLPAIIWMRSQVEGEMGALAESAGRVEEAAAHYRNSVTALEIDYPGTAVLQSARGRLAGYFLRQGKSSEATTIYREIIAANIGFSNATPALSRLLAPYAELLLTRGTDTEAVSELFTTAQVMLRPGVAQTQAILARELSSNSDEASRLFRQSVTLTRQIEQNRAELARIDLAGQVAGPVASGSRALLQAQIGELQRDQVITQASLAAFPQYRAIASDVLPLAELRATLRPDEGYYKLTVIDSLVFAIFVTPERAQAFRLQATSGELDDLVDRIRATTTANDGALEPFDIGLAEQLYAKLFAPISGELATLRHLIFEPDGAMMRLTPNLLVKDRASVDAYIRRGSAPGGDAFDFTGIPWLGRDLDISISVAPRAFRDVRAAAPTGAARPYLGFGSNAPAPARVLIKGEAAELDCSPPPGAWSRPISPDELRVARSLLGSGSQIVTGADFTDSSLNKRTDLKDYRVLHFATHGLVTPANPNCAAQPALMTSFGGAESDGLLTFREIFDLRLDADLVILSACDTAGGASAAATRAAGLGTGGGMALDGLVRAFVGAGGRTIIASHWPVPDDYKATERLVSGLFGAARGTATVTALRQSQRHLMDEKATSHPYYWAAFAIIGDGLRPSAAAR
jgi:CHAT domain-containing protein